MSCLCVHYAVQAYATDTRVDYFTLNKAAGLLKINKVAAVEVRACDFSLSFNLWWCPGVQCIMKVILKILKCVLPELEATAQLTHSGDI